VAHYSQGWQYRATVTVTPPTISAALSGYVALVRLTAANFDFTKALATGYDVRFGIVGGTAFLPFERVAWDAEGEAALFYVRIPSLPVAGTTLYVYAGNSEATDASSGADTWTDYAAVVHMIRDGEGKIHESKAGGELTLVGGVAYPASVDGQNHKAEQFDGDSEAGYWVMPAAMLPNFGSTFEQDLSLEVVAKAASTDSVDHPIVSQGDYTNTTYSVYLERYAGNIFLNDGPMVALASDAWAAITGSRDLSESIRALSVNGDSDTDAGVTNDPVDATVYIGGNGAVTTSGDERAFKGLIEEVRFVYAVRSDDWHKVFEADLIDGTLLTVGSLAENPYGWEPSGTDVEGPTDTTAELVTLPVILEASVSLEEHGVGNASVVSTAPMAVGQYLTLTNPATETDIFRGIVTRCVQDLKSRTYSIMAQDPIMALSEGEVIFSDSTGILAVLAEVATDYGQAFYTPLSSLAELAPIAALSDIDPENDLETEPVSWVDLVRTVARILGYPLTYRANGQYRVDEPTDRGTITDSQLLNASVAALTDRYANRVIVKCSGEWWSDPGAETTAVELIRGASMSVKRYGEQIREITLDSGGVYHHEVMTYDASSRMVSHVATVVTTLSNGTKFKTETTRAWTITDETDYTYTETTITQRMGYWEEDYVNQRKTEITTVVAEGSVEVTTKGYGWNFGSSAWEPLITNDSMTILRGFPSQPGVNGYGILETYQYWYDTDQSEWTYDLVKSEAASSAPSAPGFTTVLPLSKTTVNYCVTGDDETAQTALGLKEAVYSPLCVEDDASLAVLNAIALNELAWRSRCRQLTGEIALTMAEEWLPGDTFAWGGLTWTIERLEHDLSAMTTQVTATATASVAYLQKALMPEYDEAGKAIVGILKKQSEKVDNAQPATIVSQVDYETWVVQLADGSKKLAKLQYGSDALLAPGSSIMLLRGSTL
jgi:hypothetical protein